jgi:hypothetical protein
MWGETPPEKVEVPMRLFMDILPAEAREGGRLPLTYALLASLPPGSAPYMPAAPCDHHRTAGYFCLPYHKPISRCLGAGR